MFNFNEGITKCSKEINNKLTPVHVSTTNIYWVIYATCFDLLTGHRQAEGITKCSNEINNKLTSTRQHNKYLLKYIQATCFDLLTGHRQAEGIRTCSNEINNKLTSTRQHNKYFLDYIGYMFRLVNRSSSGLQQNKSQVLFRYWDPNIFTAVNVQKI